MKRFRLTPFARILCFVLVLAAVAGFAVFGIKSGFVKTGPDKAKNPISSATDMVSNDKSDDKTVPTNVGNDNVINLSLDEWIGWKPILDANGGLTTKSGSIYDNLGIKVNINVINDATQSSNALISGDLDAAGYTLNRTAFLSQKFKEANNPVVMPVFSNYSAGGDGIIAYEKFSSVESWVDARIAVPEFSEAETLVAWFIDKSDLSQGDKEKIMSNLVFFDTPDDAAKAFFAGQVDVAATWEPYLSQAEESTNSTIVFDTTASSTLIMDGIVFDAEWASGNPETVQKFIDGMLQASELYVTEFEPIKSVMPMYSTADNDSIISDCGNAKLATWADNVKILTETGPMVWNDMCDIWETLGESVDRDLVNTLFDTSYVDALAPNYVGSTESSGTVAITAEQKETAQNYAAMLTKTSTVTFVPDTAKFLDQQEASSVLDDFVSIAKTLDGSIIQIEGNINSDNDTDGGRKLSYNRAQTVANYLISQGIDSNRIIVVGNGNTKMVGSENGPKVDTSTMSTEDILQLNRRVDVMFKMVEG